MRAGLAWFGVNACLGRLSVAVVICGSIVLASGGAQAQQPRNIDLPRFGPAPAGDRFFGVPSPFTPGETTLHGGVVLDYAHDPLVITDSSGAVLGHVVEHQLLLHLNVALMLFDRLQVSADLPFAIVNQGDGTIEGGQFTGANAFVSPAGRGLGDLRFGARVRLFGGYFDPFQVAVGGYVWVPTAASNSFLGDGKVRGQPLLLLGGRVDRFIWAAAGGPSFRTAQQYGGVQLGSQFGWGAGAGILLGDRRAFQIGAETSGGVTLQKSAGHSVNGEVLLGAKLRVSPPLEIGLAAGQGFALGLGTPDFRGVFTLFYTPLVKPVERQPDSDGDGIPNELDACPWVKGPASPDAAKNGCPPDTDRDKDGISNRLDACPDEAGPANADAAKNGCPRRDQDKDGIFDDEDACPSVAGVASADPKTNGCPPPPDRDGDGVFDADDACPDVAGVKSDTPSNNGCPPDTDHDGFRDDDDACPREKGVADPDPAKRGCPRLVRVTRNEIIILEQIQFDTNKTTIKPVSGPLLDSIAQVMTEHPEITQIEVQGHTDDRGKKARNTRLSQGRAAAAKAALVSRGVAAERLVAKGFGQDVPLASNDTSEGRQKNRRVQFLVTGRTTSGDDAPAVKGP